MSGPCEGAVGAGNGAVSTPVLREIDAKVDQTTKCKLCFRPAREDDKLGPLYEYEVNRESEVYCAHYFCLLFSSGLDQNGDDDEEMKGFLAKDVLKEWRRGQRLKCTCCGERYATVGCGHRACRRTFHLPCALEEGGALPQFCGEFAVFCREHRPRQAHGKIAKGAKETCGICLDDVELMPEGKDDAPENVRLWAPCCGGWFHRECLEHLAKSTGYFFKCPLCNNKAEFEREMKQFGVYIPEQDAAWEREAGAEDHFGALLERHDSCDAAECVCPLGRKEDVDDTPWEIILCYTCGSRGIHIECGKLELSPHTRWHCDSCVKTRAKVPPRFRNHYCRAKRGRMSEETAQVLPVRLTFTLTEDHGIKIQHKGVEIIKRLRSLENLPLPAPYAGDNKDDWPRGAKRKEATEAEGEQNDEEKSSKVEEDDESEEEVSFLTQVKSPRPPPTAPSPSGGVGSNMQQRSILSYFKKPAA